MGVIQLTFDISLLLVSCIELMLEKSRPLLDAPPRQTGLTLSLSFFNILPVLTSSQMTKICQNTATKIATWITTNKANVVLSPISTYDRVILTTAAATLCAIENFSSFTGFTLRVEVRTYDARYFFFANYYFTAKSGAKTCERVNWRQTLREKKLAHPHFLLHFLSLKVSTC